MAKQLVLNDAQVASLKKVLFAAETVAHLRGHEAELLPHTEPLRDAIAACEVEQPSPRTAEQALDIVSTWLAEQGHKLDDVDGDKVEIAADLIMDAEPEEGGYVQGVLDMLTAGI